MDFHIILHAIVLFVYTSEVHGNVWTVDCGVLCAQRLDPIVYPDESPAGHVHSVIGGSKFSKSVSYENLLDSQCTRDELSLRAKIFFLITPQLQIPLFLAS